MIVALSSHHSGWQYNSMIKRLLDNPGENAISWQLLARKLCSECHAVQGVPLHCRIIRGREITKH